jgi:hypothetical protein
LFNRQERQEREDGNNMSARSAGENKMKIAVPPITVLIVRRSAGIRMYNGPTQVSCPLGSEVALLPLYELTNTVNVHWVDVSAPHVIDLISVRLHYHVADARRVYLGMSNRDYKIKELTTELQLDPHAAMLDAVFWKHLIDSQLNEDVEEIVREVVQSNPFAENALEVYRKRADVSECVRERLSVFVKRWGIGIGLVNFLQVRFDRGIFRRINEIDNPKDKVEIRPPQPEDIFQQRKLLEFHRKTLAVYIEQRAKKGMETEPATFHGIDEARSNIRRVKDILHAWGETVADHPDDEPEISPGK